MSLRNEIEIEQNLKIFYRIINTLINDESKIAVLKIIFQTINESKNRFKHHESVDVKDEIDIKIKSERTKNFGYEKLYMAPLNK